MTVIDSHKNLENLTLTFVAEFAADVERVWQVWEDPRKLERWWGPPTWPATFVRHEFVVGGQVRYFMTGPDGTKAGGWWTITAIDAPNRLEFLDGFAAEDGEPQDVDDTTSTVVTIEPFEDGTRMTLVSSFRSLEQLETMANMGMEEGLRLAMGQIDDLLRQ